MKTNVISQELWDLVISYCRGSFKNERAVKNAAKCFCYSCCSTYSSKLIHEWCDETEDSNGKRTALCPYCGIDSVVPIGPEAPVHPGFIRLLNLILGESISDVIAAEDLYYFDEKTNEKVFFEVSFVDTPTGRQLIFSDKKRE